MRQFWGSRFSSIWISPLYKKEKKLAGMKKQYFIDDHELTTNYRRLPRNTSLLGRARKMRRSGGNQAEIFFWKLVKNGAFHGLRFRRQQIIGNFIVDFYCPALRLVIELDGGIHEYQMEYDAWRQRKLEELGCKVIRFTDFLVLNGAEQVLEELKDFILEHFAK